MFDDGVVPADVQGSETVVVVVVRGSDEVCEGLDGDVWAVADVDGLEVGAGG
jgi:hypothetical protein